MPKKKQGKILCLNINAQSLNERQEIILNKGKPIGQNPKTIFAFSNFSETIVRSIDLCPFIYTN